MWTLKQRLCRVDNHRLITNAAKVSDVNAHGPHSLLCSFSLLRLLLGDLDLLCFCNWLTEKYFQCLCHPRKRNTSIQIYVRIYSRCVRCVRGARPWGSLSNLTLVTYASLN